MIFKLLHLIIMLSKYIFYGVLLQVFCLGMLMAHEGDAQQMSIKETKISLNLRNASLQQAFAAIESETDFRFSYERKDLDDGLKINIVRNEGSLEDVLMDISQNSNLKFRRINQNIHVSKKKFREQVIAEVSEYLQTISVTGRVTSEEDQQGLPGVNVVVKGTSAGTITDVNGNYAIDVPGSSAILVFSSVGYVSEEIEVGSKSVINLSLIPDITSLAEVVVIGYGSVKKSDVTGAIAQVTAEQIQEMPVQNTLQALQGRAAGIDVTSNNRPGEVGTIRIRGNRSILATNEPLYVVDGVPLQSGGIEAFNPNDIESIEVLKDASASAIYGSRAANGVVLITTKKGREGKSQITYNGSVFFERIDNRQEMFNAAEYAEFRREAFRTTNSYSTPYPNPTDDHTILGADPHAWESIAAGYSWIDKNNLIPEMRPATAEEQARWGVNEVPVYDPGKVPTTNWTDYVEQTGITQDHTIGVNVGSQKVKAYFSVGYLNQKGTVTGQDYNRYTGRLNLEMDATDWLTVGSNITGTYSIQNYGYSAGGSRGSRTLYEAANGQLPFAVPFDPDGNYIYLPGEDVGIVNPIRDGDLVINERTVSRMMGSFFAEIKLAPGLRYKAIFGPDIRNYENGEFESEESSLRGGGAPTSTNRARYRQENQFSWTLENLLFYDKSFDLNHKIGITLLQSSSKWQRKNSDMTATNLPYNSQLWYNLGSTAQGALDGWGSGFSERMLLSYMARLNYSFREKYLLTATGRWDGASVLAEGNKWDFFPSFAFAWRLDQESFMNEISAISLLKPRIGLGTIGNAAVNPYSTAGGLVQVPYVFGNEPALGYVPSNPKGAASDQGSLPNKQLGWEKTMQWNFGIDFAAFNGRLSGSVDYYIANTFDLIMPRALPTVTGYVASQFNIGRTRNRGIELAINSLNIDKNDFSWSSTIVFSKNKEEIIELFDGKEDAIAQNWFIGQPIHVFYDLKKTGIWQEEDLEMMEAYNAKGATYKLGDVRVEDVNMDTVIDQNNDRQIIGSLVPKWTAGITNTFTYKNWELSAFVFARWGSTVMVNAPDMQGRYASPKIDYWTPENPTNAYPVPDYGNGGQPVHWSSMNYHDGSFIKVRYISLGYVFPKSVTERFNMSNLRIYGQVMNPFLYSKTSFIDPDIYFQNVSPGVPNISATSVSSRSFVLGLNVTF